MGWPVHREHPAARFPLCRGTSCFIDANPSEIGSLGVAIHEEFYIDVCHGGRNVPDAEDRPCREV